MGQINFVQTWVSFYSDIDGDSIRKFPNFDCKQTKTLASTDIPFYYSNDEMQTENRVYSSAWVLCHVNAICIGLQYKSCLYFVNTLEDNNSTINQADLSARVFGLAI